MEWQPWQFKTTPRNFWKDRKNQRTYLDYLSKKLNIQRPEDWYNMDTQSLVLKDKKAQSLLIKYYQSSLYKALESIYPHYHWKPWYFSRVPQGFWKDKLNQEEYLQWLANELNIRKRSDWENIKLTDVHNNGGGGLLVREYHGSLKGALSSILPEEDDNNKSDINTGRKKRRKRTTKKNDKDSLFTLRKSQKRLSSLLQNIFPSQKLLNDFKHADMTYSQSKEPMQLDIYLPDLSLAFEYQGKHHYQDNFLFGSSRLLQQKVMTNPII